MKGGNAGGDASWRVVRHQKGLRIACPLEPSKPLEGRACRMILGAVAPHLARQGRRAGPVEIEWSRNGHAFSRDLPASYQ